jgi:RimJ/RimL family protein N-acetyltransferase
MQKQKLKLIKINNLNIQKKEIIFIKNLYNKNIIMKKFFNSKIITNREHMDWIKKNKENTVIFVAKNFDKNVGYIRYQIKNKKIILSLAISQKFQNQKLGTQILSICLNKIKKKYNNYKIYAYIKNKNSISKNFFKKNNFTFRNFYQNKYIMALDEKKIYK